MRVLDRLAASIGAQDLIEYIDEVMRSAGAARMELSQIVANGDFTRVAQLAHGLKTGCGYLGASGLVERLDALETRAREGTPALVEVTGVLADLDSFLVEVRSEREARAKTGR